ncbi:hypothetical protein FraEuI1c_2763 [Pseudofrankia inefficax]|uniref:Uncharacterized protein n=1 Tax=Pseudofrankia inefficax (strain DSM 45817 / CECT 9037 / DDB 130130 / EuI1c) TaxID=298654 RepID=E3J6L4_PSEI1|nr:hypothetical protein FraEuI1c_2763 [Pseudofrankia inefficax]
MGIDGVRRSADPADPVIRAARGRGRPHPPAVRRERRRPDPSRPRTPGLHRHRGTGRRRRDPRDPGTRLALARDIRRALTEPRDPGSRHRPRLRPGRPDRHSGRTSRSPNLNPSLSPSRRRPLNLRTRPSRRMTVRRPTPTVATAVGTVAAVSDAPSPPAGSGMLPCSVGANDWSARCDQLISQETQLSRRALAAASADGRGDDSHVSRRFPVPWVRSWPSCPDGGPVAISHGPRGRSRQAGTTRPVRRLIISVQSSLAASR